MLKPFQKAYLKKLANPISHRYLIGKGGWYISFSGVVSFKNARKVREVAEAVPEDMILIETDCPYLAPEPNRGKLNRSDYLVYTLSALAEAKHTDAESLGNTVFANSRRLFGV